jgi:hypothetical protein
VEPTGVSRVSRGVLPMSERFRPDIPDEPPPEIVSAFPPLPPWLREKLLRPDEEITWVRGPRWNPSWEKYATHPAVVLVALGLGVVCLALGRLISGSWEQISPIFPIAALIVVVGSVCALGIFNGHFTRLVVTNFRIVIMQGYEVSRTWSLDSLPRSLIRYVDRDGEEGGEKQAVDLGALQKMLGGSGGFVEAKAVWDLGKQLDHFKKRGGRG